jgi:hypothetical protein
MERDIIVFEAPIVTRTASGDEEKYTQLGKIYHVSTMRDLRYLEDNDMKGRFDSNIPALMVQEIMKYFYPIWDRLNEKAPQKSTYTIKVPLRVPALGYFYGKNTYTATKSGDSADVIGFRIPKTLSPQHILSHGPLYEEIFKNPPLCNPKYMIFLGRFGLNLITEPLVFTQQIPGFPHILPFENSTNTDIIRFDNQTQAMGIMKRILSYLDYMKEFYTYSSTIYHGSLLGDFAEFMKSMTTVPTRDKRSEQIYDHPSIYPSSNEISIILDLCHCTFPDLGPYSILDIPLHLRDSWWLSLSSYRLLLLYILAINHLPGYDKVHDDIQQERMIIKSVREYHLRVIKYQEAESIKLIFARRKFGISKLSLLSKAQMDIVMRDYESYTRTSDVPVEIRRTIKQFQESIFGPTDSLRITFKRLKNAIKINDPDIYEKYSICPHRIELANSLLNGSSRADAINDIKIKYASPDLMEYYGFFCSKCGEMIKKLESSEIMEFIDFGDIYMGKDVEDTLGMLIHKIVLNVLGNDVIFEGNVRLIKVADHITAAIKPKIIEMEKQLLKSKTTLAERIPDLLSVYIHIYTMAIVIRMIQVNPDVIRLVDLTIDSKRGGGANECGEVVVKITSCGEIDEDSPIIHENEEIGIEKIGGKSSNVQVAKLIASAKKILQRNIAQYMKRITNLKSDSLVKLLVHAYRWTETLREANTDKTQASDGRLKYLLSTTIYKYVYMTHVTAGLNTAYDDTVAVIGRTHEEIEAGDVNLYSNIPILDKWKNASDYEYRSYLSMMIYLKDGKFRLFAMPESSKNPELVKYEEEFADLIKYERVVDWQFKLYRLFPLVKPPSVSKPPMYYNAAYRKLNYAQYYDMNGKPRSWDSIIYVDPTGKKITIPIKDIGFDPAFDSMTFYDWVDSTTGDTYNEITNPAIEEKVKMRYSINCFYAYYTSRCPEDGNLHDMKDGVCIKCKYPTVAKDVYFLKYQKVYRELISTQSHDDNVVLNAINNRTKLKAPPRLNPWKISQDILLQWSKISRIEFRRINNIGLYWKCTEDDIESGKCDPLSSANDDDMRYRLLVLKSYYLYISRIYNSVKYDPMMHTYPEYAELFRKHKTVLSKIQQTMPNINSDLIFAQVDQEAQIEVSCNFLLSSIGNLLLQIYKQGDTFGKMLFDILTKKILRMEVMSTKPPPLSGIPKPAAPVVNQYDDTDDEVDDSLSESFSDAGKPMEDSDTDGEGLFSFANSGIAELNDGNDDSDTDN